jgi:hypothetical protein
MSFAMQLRFSIAIGCDAKLLKPQMVIEAVVFPFYLFKSSQVFNRLTHSTEHKRRSLYARAATGVPLFKVVPAKSNILETGTKLL